MLDISNKDTDATQDMNCVRRTGIEHCQQGHDHWRAPKENDRQPGDKDRRKATEILIDVETVCLERDVYQRVLWMSR